MRAAYDVLITLLAGFWRELCRRASAPDIPAERLVAGLVRVTVERPGRS
jgi:hypothetical protein